MESLEPIRERRAVPRTITPMTVATLHHSSSLRFPLKQDGLTAAVRAALQEDGAFNDLTSIATVVSDRRARGTLVARERGVIAGIPQIGRAHV